MHHTASGPRGRTLAWLASALLLSSLPVASQTFKEALVAAERADAQFNVALAGVANRRVQVQEAKAAFYPSATVSYSRADLTAGSTGASYAATITQPLLSYDRYLTLQQVDPIAALVLAEDRQARNDLALRLFRVMADIIRNREAIRSISIQIEGLETQLKRAQRMRELGQGTITEVSDYEVRLAVAQANRVNQRSNLDAALRNFTLITGLQGQPERINVADAAPQARPFDEGSFVIRVRETATPVVSARQNLRLQEISAKRLRAEFLPSVVAVAGRGRTAGSTSSSTDTRVGIVFNAPLGAGQWFNAQRAATDLQRAQESLRLAQDNAANEAQRVWKSSESLDTELQIRRRAVEAAKLALEGNIKSYQGGVKSNIDVVTSYQNLADAETALVNSEVSRTETLLTIRLLDPVNAP
jgi:protease secretion system outer membrane protein